MLKRPLPLPVRVLVFAVLLLTGACSTPNHPEGPARGAGLPPVSLAGESRFFDEKLLVVATLRNSERPRFDGDQARADGQRPRGGGRSPGEGGFGSGAGPRRMPQGDFDQPTGARLRPAHGPTLTLKVTLNNTSAETLTVVVREVKSELGNFAARPERITLEPQQSLELDPMFPLADSVVGSMPLTVALRSAEQTESHILMLQPAPPSVPTPPPAAAPGVD